MAIAELIDNSIQWKKSKKVSVEVRLIEYEDNNQERLSEIQILQWI